MSEADQPEIFTYPDLDEKKVSWSQSMNPGRSVELYDLLLLKVALIRPNLNDTTVLNDTLKKSEKLDFAFDKVFQPEIGRASCRERV